ncbi:MAG: TonB family protein [Pseudomonadota bacterium]
MSTEENSAEILELNDARRRLRDGQIDLGAYATAGAFLAAVREDAGLSVEDISERTHIKTAFLVAIEQNETDALPSRPFAIGFVKGYAEALGLDPAPVVSRYKQDAGFEAVSDVEQASETPVAVNSDADQERSDMSLLAVFAIFIFILWCAWHITRPRAVTTPFKFDGLPALEAAAPAPAETAAPAIGAPAPELPFMIEARAIEQVEPVYPSRCEAGAAATESVTVAFTVTVEGGVASERVVDATNACFERASLNAIRRWRFAPRTVDGAPQAAFEQTVTFPFNKPL